MQDFDTIIIGSGAGGLIVVLYLARAGQKVLVLEQHYVPGGWCHSLIRDGHTFSPNVHFVGHTQEGESGGSSGIFGFGKGELYNGRNCFGKWRAL